MKDIPIPAFDFDAADMAVHPTDTNEPENGATDPDTASTITPELGIGRDAMAAIVAESVAPLTDQICELAAQIASQQETIDALVDVDGAFGTATVADATEKLNQTIDTISQRMDRRTRDRIEMIVKEAEPAVIPRQRAILNMLIDRFVDDKAKRDELEGFCTFGEFVDREEYGVGVHIAKKPSGKK